MYEVGQEVLLMSAAGRFQIMAIDGDLLTIENGMGIRRIVLSRAVRLAPPRQS